MLRRPSDRSTAAAALLATLALVAAGCAPPEATRIAASPAAVAGPAPRLVPTGEFAGVAAAGDGAAAITAGASDIAARAAALRSRAQELDGPVIDADALAVPAAATPN